MLLNDTSYVDSVRVCVHAKSCMCVVCVCGCVFALTDLVPDLLRLQSSMMPNFHSEDGGSRFLQNGGTCLPDYMASHTDIWWHECHQILSLFKLI